MINTDNKSNQKAVDSLFVYSLIYRKYPKMSTYQPTIMCTAPNYTFFVFCRNYSSKKLLDKIPCLLNKLVLCSTYLQWLSRQNATKSIFYEINFVQRLITRKGRQFHKWIYCYFFLSQHCWAFAFLKRHENMWEHNFFSPFTVGLFRFRSYSSICILSKKRLEYPLCRGWV